MEGYSPTLAVTLAYVGAWLCRYTRTIYVDVWDRM
jgi:hypothetical protein